MKKIISILATLMFTTMNINFVKAEGFAVGVTGAYTMIDGTGSEVETTGNTETNSGSASNEVFTGSVFGEYSFANVSYADTGVTFGVRYTPGSADVSKDTKTRTDANSEGDSATYRAQAQLENYINYYLDIPLYKNMYVKAGWSQIDVKTQESVSTGTIGTYGDATLDGINYGIGFKGENGNIVWKFAYEATNFDTLNLTSTTDHTINADLDTSEVNLSIGYKF